MARIRVHHGIDNEGCTIGNDPIDLCRKHSTVEVARKIIEKYTGEMKELNLRLLNEQGQDFISTDDHPSYSELVEEGDPYKCEICKKVLTDKDDDI